MEARSYRRLTVWNESVELVVAVYALTAGFPDSEKFGLTSQMRRASVSVPSNIAEGYGRGNRGDYVRHLLIARASLMELETQIVIAVKLELADKSKARELWRVAQQVGKRLNRLIRSLQSPNPETDP